MSDRQGWSDDEAVDVFKAGEGFEPDTTGTDAIAAAVAARDRAEAVVSDAVEAARAAGVTWAEIGRVLGVGHRAAVERYSTGEPGHD